MAKKIKHESAQPQTDIPLLSHPSVRNQGRTRGRPLTIGDNELGARRSGIKLTLEENWGDIAWKCMHIRTPEDIRKAFTALPHNNNSTSGRLVDCLIRPSFENATGRKVAQARREYWCACGRTQTFGERCRDLTKAVEQSNRAKRELLSETSLKFSSEAAAEQLRYIEDQISKNEQEAERLKEERDKARALADGCYEQLELYESAFARNEVLDFLLT